jgi:DNA repair protein RadA/Sms
LTGEIRPVNNVDRLINEGMKIGYTTFVIPERNKEKIKVKGVELITVSTLKEAITKLF